MHGRRDVAKAQCLPSASLRVTGRHFPAGYFEAFDMNCRWSGANLRGREWGQALEITPHTVHALSVEVHC